MARSPRPARPTRPRHTAPAHQAHRPRRPADAVRLAAVRAYLDFRAGQSFRENAPAAIAEPEARRLYAHLVRGLVRHQRLLEAQVERLGGRPLARLDAEAAAVAMLGLYQLRFLAMPPHAAVYETVELMGPLRLASAKSWVNGVLRAALREKAGKRSGGEPASAPGWAAWERGLSLAQRTSHPDWLVQRWEARYGAAAAEAICQANARYESLSLRAAQTPTAHEPKNPPKNTNPKRKSRRTCMSLQRLSRKLTSI